MEFIELLISLGHQPLAWMCFFLGMAVFSFICLAWTTNSAIRQRRAAGNNLREYWLERERLLQVRMEKDAHMMLWRHRMTRRDPRFYAEI